MSDSLFLKNDLWIKKSHFSHTTYSHFLGVNNLGDWNKQASQNNNIQPDLNFNKEELAEKKVQLNVQEQIGIEAIGQQEKDVTPQAGQ